MIRRRRLIITPGPGRQLPDPEDPSLPQVSPQQPEAEPPLPEPPLPGPPPGDDEPQGPRSGAPRSTEAWLRGLGVASDEKRHAWLEPHLWAALRARLDASDAERRARWVWPRLH